MFVRDLLYNFWDTSTQIWDNQNNPDDSTLKYLTAKKPILKYKILLLTIPGIGFSVSWPEWISNTRHEAQFCCVEDFINTNSISNNHIRVASIIMRIKTSDSTQFAIYRARTATLHSTTGTSITSAEFMSYTWAGGFYGIR